MSGKELKKTVVTGAIYAVTTIVVGIGWAKFVAPKISA